MSSETDTTSSTPFPFETRVILHGLVKAPDLNGKLGVVRSEMNSAGRYSVFIKEDNKTVGLKPSNLQYEPRTVDSLSAKELKLVLKGKKVDDAEYSGIDKSDLKSKVSELVPEEEDIPKLLAVGMASQPKPPAAAKASKKNKPNGQTPTPSQAAQAADQLSKMSPDQLRQQAQMMRTMDKNSIRRMNPQFAHMTDAQITQVADQLEMMANNPALMEMATNQMKNMDPAELQRMQAQARNGTMPTGGPPPAMGGNPSQQNDMASQMANSDNPMQMLAGMDKTQLKNTMKMVKDNPDMLKQFAAQSGVSEEQLKQGLEMFSGMDDDKLDAALNMMQKAASAKEKWNTVDQKTGGHLLKILILGGVLAMYGFLWFFFFRKAATSGTTSTILEDVPNIAQDVPIEESEF